MSYLHCHKTGGVSKWQVWFCSTFLVPACAQTCLTADLSQPVAEPGNPLPTGMLVAELASFLVLRVSTTYKVRGHGKLLFPPGDAAGFETHIRDDWRRFFLQSSSNLGPSSSETLCLDMKWRRRLWTPEGLLVEWLVLARRDFDLLFGILIVTSTFLISFQTRLDWYWFWSMIIYMTYYKLVIIQQTYSHIFLLSFSIYVFICFQNKWNCYMGTFVLIIPNTVAC